MLSPYSPTQAPLPNISAASPKPIDTNSPPNDSGNSTLPIVSTQYDAILGVLAQILGGVNSQTEHLCRLPLSHEVGVAMLSAKVERLYEAQERQFMLIQNLGRLMISLLQAPTETPDFDPCGLCGGLHPWEFCPQSSPGYHCTRCWEPDHALSRYAYKYIILSTLF